MRQRDRDSRERQRQRDRERERKRERQRERQQRETETESQRVRETERQRDRDKDRQTETETEDRQRQRQRQMREWPLSCAFSFITVVVRFCSIRPACNNKRVATSPPLVINTSWLQVRITGAFSPRRRHRTSDRAGARIRMGYWYQIS